jgi:hypothetical protein
MRCAEDSGSPVLPAPTTRAELVESLRGQIEHYFSRENLQTDQFLVSQMNAQFFVPLPTVARFPRVRALTSDMKLIVEALEGSPLVELDPTKTMVRPNVHSERNTIILREVPADTSEEELRTLFAGVEDCALPLSVREDAGSIWLVTMESEKDAQTAMRKLRSAKIREAPLRMRLKSENTVRGLLASMSTRPSPSGSPPSGPATSTPGGVPHAEGGIPPYAFGTGVMGGMPSIQVAAAMSMRGAPVGVVAAVAAGDLVGPMATVFTPSVPAHLPAVTYTADQILAVAAGMGTNEEAVRMPAGFDQKKHDVVFAARPNADLLLRQRTMSVDASLAAGRPRIDSVASVDVTSMHYGDSERGRRKSSAAAARGIEVIGTFEPPANAEAPPSDEVMSDLFSQALGKTKPAGKQKTPRRKGEESPARGKPVSSAPVVAKKPGPYAQALLKPSEAVTASTAKRETPSPPAASTATSAPPAEVEAASRPPMATSEPEKPAASTGPKKPPSFAAVLQGNKNN